ncbi:phage tail assembly chaperone [Pseudomonas lundensis]|uniref:phage tail assembly chaperone n=1 Tax=Pseudomonas lundensis TaxID=86185 RepID=UPI001D01EDD6|nr:phage tail assembly chaperone [Pseudomonas lundensis]
MAKKYAMFGANGVRISQLHEALHDIPESAVPISEALFIRMTQETDGIWMLGEDGSITKQPFVQSLPDQSAYERRWRDAEVESVKWLRERHRDEADLGIKTSLTADQFIQLLSYLQALRDWPQAPDFPVQNNRPVQPDWIAEQTH